MAATIASVATIHGEDNRQFRVHCAPGPEEAAAGLDPGGLLAPPPMVDPSHITDASDCRLVNGTIVAE
ncbi:hypothetical protein HaLaN_27282 [Haematococcus lacustris]|uniref:Uncharacterized protein n=1 Tax=Haematococcus lacustris TaxID=44745 RepID=A0A6A0A8E9_HAELA|nr:hypothetical protein HaLaN_27282 [Haematococcus lacustris]